MKIILFILLGLISFNVQAEIVKVTRMTFSIPNQTINGDPLEGENSLAGLLLTCDRTGAGEPPSWGFKKTLIPASWEEGTDKNGSPAVVIVLAEVMNRTDPTAIYCVAQFYNTVNDYAPYSKVISFNRVSAGVFTYDNGKTITASPMATEINLD